MWLINMSILKKNKYKFIFLHPNTKIPRPKRSSTREFPLYRFIALILGVGYQLTFAGDWEAENEQSISGIPSDLSADGFFIQAGIFAGFFSF